MKQFYLCQNAEELTALQSQAQIVTEGVTDYLAYLRKNMKVEKYPDGIIWADKAVATEVVADRDMPVPAYTGDRRMVMVPYANAWEEVYLKQLKGYDTEHEAVKTVREYYKHLTENQIRQILGHEFVHWSELFKDELYEDTMWFEEGMAEYVSRKWFLTEEEYMREKHVNQLLIALYEEKNGERQLEDFTYDVYEEGMQAIFYFYWKSFLFVESLVKSVNGNLIEIFERYQRWSESKMEMSLLEWFSIK